MKAPKILDKTFLAKSLYYIFAFIQFYPVIPIGVGVSTRILSCFCGVLLLIISIYNDIEKRRTFYLNKKIVFLAVPLFAMVFCSLISMLVNNDSSDPFFVKYVFTPTIMLFAAYNTLTIGIWAFGREHITFKFIALTLVKIVMVQDILSVIMKAVPAVQNFLYSLILLDPVEWQVFGKENAQGGRLPGFGANFMNLGVANNAVLLLIAVLIKNASKYQMTLKQILTLAFCFIYISVIGLMQARTTMVGMGLGMLYMVASSYTINLHSLAKSISSIFKFLMIVAVLGWIIVSILPDTLQKNANLIDYGFEVFLNIIHKGKVESGSTNVLKNMLIYPDNLKTWIIGDAHFLGLTGGFYMGTDIGWLRLIYYFGIIGALIYYSFEVVITFQTFLSEEKNARLISIYFLGMILITHLKSFTEITTYIALFWVYNILVRDPKNHLINKLVDAKKDISQSKHLIPN